MRTGEMKYVILRIDTHVLRIDLCPRKRTRIRRQKQDEDVHLFLSERKKARPLPRQRPSLTPPRPRKVSNKLFQGFRRVGKAQTSCFKVSDASERLKQVVSRFPRPRGVCGRPLPGQGSWPGTRRDPNARTRVGAGVCGRRRILPGIRRDPNACTRVGAYCIRPPNGPPGPNDGARTDARTAVAHSPPMVAPGGAYSVAPPTRVPAPTNQRGAAPNKPTSQRAFRPNNINRAARPPTLSELWTQERITRTCSSSCCSS